MSRHSRRNERRGGQIGDKTEEKWEDKSKLNRCQWGWWEGAESVEEMTEQRPAKIEKEKATLAYEGHRFSIMLNWGKVCRSAGFALLCSSISRALLTSPAVIHCILSQCSTPVTEPPEFTSFALQVLYLFKKQTGCMIFLYLLVECVL